MEDFKYSEGLGMKLEGGENADFITENFMTQSGWGF